MLLLKTYAALNARDIHTALTLMHPDFNWSAGIGGAVTGHAAVRACWLKLWGSEALQLIPIEFTFDGASRIAVVAHQLNYGPSGEITGDAFVSHIFRFDGVLIKSIDLAVNSRAMVTPFSP